VQALRSTAYIFISSGLILLIWNKWAFSDSRWVPVDSVPLPKSDSKIVRDFKISRGVYQIEIELPMAEGRQNDVTEAVVPAVDCQINVYVHDGSLLISTLEVRSLHHSGTIFSSRTDCFYGGMVTIPKARPYSVEVVNKSSNPIISRGHLSFERAQNAEDASFLSGYSKMFSWLSLGVGCYLWLRWRAHAQRSY
jgi:hypothetical protein